MQIVIPECETIPKHEKVELPAEIYDPLVLPKLFELDPACVWYGLKKGDIVRVMRYSETTAVTPVYRLVV